MPGKTVSQAGVSNGVSTDPQRQRQVIPGLMGHFTALSFTLNREWGALNRSDMIKCGLCGWEQIVGRGMVGDCSPVGKRRQWLGPNGERGGEEVVFESRSIEFSLGFDAEERGLAKEKSKG